MRAKFAVLFLFILSLANAQMAERFVFYNVENAFHPAWDSLNPDREFSKAGTKDWDSTKYYHKLNQIAKVILSLSQENYETPALIGLAEVECRQVLADLIRRPSLKKLDYQFVHYESPDRRGIDVALIYRKSKLKLIESKALPYSFPQDSSYRSRDMLYAKFYHQDLDTLNFLINHWPSRYGGKEKSEPRRLAAAKNAFEFLGALPFDNLIVMGDFNDEPQDSSIKFLGNRLKVENLMLKLETSMGSHRYKGDWAYLDQILFRSTQNKGKELVIDTAAVHQVEFLLEPDMRFPGNKPFRSFKGSFYQGGFSDHLPVYVDIKQKQTQPQ